jgi:NAD(P)-dependent dehydrogenase (short-subunit alcohol dehydrogenase family)
MKTQLSIVTGGSRGLGRALVEQRLARGHHVLSIARRPADLPVPAGAALDSWTADLGDPVPVAERLRAWLAAQDPATLAGVELIHNAGVVSTPAPLSAGNPVELSHALRVGLEAPLLLSASFLQATDGWAMPRRLLLISSGLGRRAMAGSASYCAAKAGMDHLARVLALEEAAKAHGARVVSLAPGVIDTDMQLVLRGADPARFPERVRFQSLKDHGQLDSPAQAAAKVLKVLDRDDFGTVPVADVRELA